MLGLAYDTSLLALLSITCWGLYRLQGGPGMVTRRLPDRAAAEADADTPPQQPEAEATRARPARAVKLVGGQRATS